MGNRRTCLLVLFGICIGVVGTRWLLPAAGASAEQVAREQEQAVVSEEFRLVDGQGRTRAQLSMEHEKHDGPSLRLLDENGQIRVRVIVDRSEPWCYFYDTEGQTVAYAAYGGLGDFRAFATGVPVVPNQPRSSLSMTAGGINGASIKAKSSEGRAAIFANGDHSSISVMGPDGAGINVIGGEKVADTKIVFMCRGQELKAITTEEPR